MRVLAGYMIVFLGAGLGGTLRHAVNRLALAYGSTYPWHTLAINVCGGLAMGLLAGWLAFRGDAAQTVRLFLATGIVGGFTTFSAFSLEVVVLWERGQMWGALAYIVGSVVLSVAAVSLGLAAMRA